jgi:uncharacterized protein
VDINDLLNNLISRLAPVLQAGEYAFCHFPEARYGDHGELEPVGAFLEAEGLTLIVDADTALGHGLVFDGVYRMITLTVESSLTDVGLTACVATALAEQGISANVVAARYHDHLFVPAADAARALRALRALQAHAAAAG